MEEDELAAHSHIGGGETSPKDEKDNDKYETEEKETDKEINEDVEGLDNIRKGEIQEKYGPDMKNSERENAESILDTIATPEVDKKEENRHDDRKEENRREGSTLSQKRAHNKTKKPLVLSAKLRGTPKAKAQGKKPLKNKSSRNAENGKASPHPAETSVSSMGGSDHKVGQGEDARSVPPETVTKAFAQSYKRVISRQASRSRMSIDESCGLDMKNIFKSTAKMALDESRSKPNARAETGETRDQLKQDVEKADNILRSDYDESLKPRWSKAWKAALTKLELVLPIMAKENTATSSEEPMDEEDLSEQDRKIKETLESIKEEMDGKGLEDLQPTVNGLHHFGISKTGIARAVVKFAAPPITHPSTLCFHFPHTFLNHNYVKHMVLSKVKGIDGAAIVSIQYQDRNVFHGTRNLDNRWIVRLRPIQAYEAILKTGIEVCNRRIAMRPYDDVVQDEYNEFIEYIQMQKKFMYDKIESLTGTMPNSALSIMQDVSIDMLPEPERQMLKHTLQLANMHETSLMQTKNRETECIKEEDEEEETGTSNMEEDNFLNSSEVD